ncbi:bile acid:sodium symporter family protein [Acetonema longum]|uniref:Bile acid:sodium symporter n=1 Tax=Acetonema longum DSM 6540 TaxID=1009370 RepID=F7NDL6_9FIRM|nr:bile acid:sodium symporter family protein [Acetonema longum]EGO65878.1 bile acid:sodium symporter [Acetonema longum DSM 6540]
MNITRIAACWNQWFGQRMFYLVLSGIFCGFILDIPKNAFYIKPVIIGAFAYMTFITALGTSLKKFIGVLGKPWLPLWILALIHLAAPLLAWLIGLLFFPDNESVRLGFLISASIPIGVTSLIWVSITKANAALALVVVTLDTLIVPVLLPLFFKIIIGKTLQIDYLSMAYQLLIMVTIPSLIGMAANDLTHGKLTSFANSIGGLSSKVAFFLVIFLNAAIVAPSIHWSMSVLKILIVVFLTVAAGYLLGFLGSLPLKEHRRESAFTMIYTVGMRNISFGLVMAMTYFPPAVAIPIILAMLFQQPLAAIIPQLFRCIDKYNETTTNV